MNIVIVGLGVIGGSFAMCLKEAGYENVYGIDVNDETLVKAKNQGLIKEGYKDGSELLREADITMLSIYPKYVTKYIRDNREYFKIGSVSSDATGI